LAARIAVTALQQAIAERQPPPGVVIRNGAVAGPPDGFMKTFAPLPFDIPVPSAAGAGCSSGRW
jgi:hypothetical protein